MYEVSEDLTVKNSIIDHRKNGIAVSRKMILIEARRLAIEMSITDFAGTTSWCERFMRRNGLCMHTITDILYEESDTSSENNHEVDFSGSDDDFLGFDDE
jgi:hypothetical protein